MSIPIKTILVAGVFRSGQTWLCYLLSGTLNYLFIEPYCCLRGINHSLDPIVNDKCWAKDGDLRGIVIKTHATPDPYCEADIQKIVIFRNISCFKV